MGQKSRIEQMNEGKEPVTEAADHEEVSIFDLTTNNSKYEEDETSNLDRQHDKEETEEDIYNNYTNEEDRENDRQEPQESSKILEAQAAQAVMFLDMIFSRGAAFTSGLDYKKYKISKDEKEELTEVMGAYLKTTDFEVSPGWVLIGAIGTVFGLGVMGEAFNDRKKVKRTNEIENLKTKATITGKRSDIDHFMSETATATRNDNLIIDRVRKHFQIGKTDQKYTHPAGGGDYIKPASSRIDKPDGELLELILRLKQEGKTQGQINSACIEQLKNRGVAGYV